MRRIAWLAGLVPVGVAWACSSAANHPNALEGNPGQDSGYIVPIRDSAVPDTHVCFGEVDGGCNTLALCGRELTIANTTKQAPAATGGTIVDGTYLLTSSTFYQIGGQGVNGTIREVIQITGSSAPDGGTEAGAESGAAEGGSDESGTDDGSTESGTDGAVATPAGTVQEISQQPGATPGTLTWALTLFQPATMQWTELCPSAGAGAMAFQLKYTATPTTLIAYVEEATGVWEFTYEKQ